MRFICLVLALPFLSIAAPMSAGFETRGLEGTEENGHQSYKRDVAGAEENGHQSYKRDVAGAEESGHQSYKREVSAA
ncbi:hypothetical protein CBS147325_4925 [Penicillium roqueforti]|nr:hypothetical protein CBS147325_4925 [Penicillium roqueforti]KAI3151595.1 hypothetical protein DTO046C5_9214 [Penicillium roqueforti]KAI3281006.1 hypothetical protein DTO002I6_10001 [Penicillium roqueforti]